VKIALTGGTGFIGTHLLTSLLSDGHEVMSLGRSMGQNLSNSRFIHVNYSLGEILPEALISFEPEALIHLAWEGIPDFSLEMCLKNVNEQGHFISEISKLNSIKKVIATGTCMEYAAKTGMCSVTERNAPHSYFSWSKQAVADFLKIICQSKKIKLVWFRLFYVYGPGQRPASLIPTLINNFKNGDLPTLNNPFVANDYIYIKDVVNAFELALVNPSAEGTFNLGSGEATPAYKISSIVEMHITNQEAVSKGFELNKGLTSGPGFYADIESSQSGLGWIPKWSLSDGIAETCKSFLHV
jgi:UDP-glucose 4-epimerase